MMENTSIDPALAARFRDVEENLKTVEENMAAAAARAGRKREDIILLAATKTVPVQVVNHGIEAGIRFIGENRVQELLDKYDAYRSDLAQLHFIGHLQSNKVKYLVGRVSLIQSVDSLKLAKEISRLSVQRGLRTGVLLEVNIGREPSKSGVLPEALEELVDQAAQLPGVQVQGLMAIPPAGATTSEAFGYFAKMHDYYVDMSRKKSDNVSMRYLSMGMSADYALAIEAGANMVRVGSALFGPRAYPHKAN